MLQEEIKCNNIKNSTKMFNFYHITKARHTKQNVHWPQIN